MSSKGIPIVDGGWLCVVEERCAHIMSDPNIIRKPVPPPSLLLSLVPFPLVFALALQAQRLLRKTLLPFRYGPYEVLSFGIVSPRPGFHTKAFMFPPGYRCTHSRFVRCNSKQVRALAGSTQMGLGLGGGRAEGVGVVRELLFCILGIFSSCRFVVAVVVSRKTGVVWVF